jgi:hypothetical protein
MSKVYKIMSSTKFAESKRMSKDMKEEEVIGGIRQGYSHGQIPRLFRL